MKYYKLRIDTVNKEQCEYLVTHYSPSCYLWCFEKVGTPDQHAHFYLESECENTAIRAHIRAKFGKGNGVYSLKALKSEKPIEYLAYLTKDGNYFSKNLDLTDALAYDDKMKNELKDKKSKKKQTVFSQICDEYLQSEAYKEILESNNYQYLAYWVIEWHLKNEKQLSEFRIKGYVQTLACKYHEYSTLMAYQIVKFF